MRPAFTLTNRILYFAVGVALCGCSKFGSLKYTANVLPPTSLSLQFPAFVTSGACLEASVTAVDVNGRAKPVKEATSITWEAQGNLDFYSDSGCATSVTGVRSAVRTALNPSAVAVMATNTSKQLMYFKSATSGAVIVTVSTEKLGTTTEAVEVSPGSFTNEIQVNGDSTIVAGTCEAYELKLVTIEGGEAVLAPFNLTLSLSGQGSGSFYGDVSCTSDITSATLASGSSNVTVYYQSLVTGNTTLGADDGDGGAGAGSKAVTIQPGPATILAVSGPNSAGAGECTTAFTVETRDTLGHASSPASALTVNLTGAGASGAFYADSGCSSTATSVSIGTSATSATFYYRSTLAGTPTFTAAANTFTSGTKNFTVNAGAPSEVLFTAGSTTLTAGVCAPTAYTLNIRDTHGNAATYASDTTITLSNGGSGTFYNAATCTGGTVTSLTLTAGASSKVFQYRNDVAESVTLTAAISELANATRAVTINPAAPNKLTVSGPTTVTAGTCSTAYTIRSRDSLNNPSNVAGLTSITLSGNGAGAYYSDSSCAGATTTSASISANANSTTVYFRDDTAQGLTLTAASPPLTNGTLVITVAAAAPTQLVFSGPSTLTAGTCSTAFTLNSRDQFGNNSNVSALTAITLAGVGAGSFYTGSGCTGGTSSVNLAASTNAITLYFRDDTAPQSLTLSATVSSGLTAASHALSVNPGAPNKLILTGSATLTAGTCSGVYTVTVADSLNNPSPVGSGTIVMLTGGAGSYFSDASCATPAFTVTVSNATSAASLYYRSETAESFTINVAAASIPTAGTRAVTVNPAPPMTLTLGGPISLSAGSCSAAYTVIAIDDFDNASPVATDLPVALSGQSAGTFYSDAGCTVTATGVTIASGTSGKNFYFKNNSVEVITVQANGGALGTVDLGVAINPSKILMSLGSSATAGACTSFTVSTADANDVPANVPANLTVTPTVSAGSGLFFSNAGCTTPAATGTITSGTSSVTFYLKDELAESFTVRANAPGMAQVTQSFTVNPGAPFEMTGTGPSSAVANICSTAITLTSRDSYNNASNVSTNTTVTLTGNGAGTFYSDTGCSSSTSSVTILSGTSSISYYFRGSTAQSLTFNADAGALGALNHPFTVNPATPAVLAVAGPSTVAAGACTTAITITSQDNFLNPSPVSSNLAVTLSGAGTGTFHSDSACLTSIGTSATIGTGTSSKLVYYRNTTATSVTLGFAASGLSSTSLGVTITPGPPAQLTVSGPSPVTAGVCSTAYTITVRDQHTNVTTVSSNTAVTLGGRSLGNFFSDSGCIANANASGVTVLSGTSTIPFYFRNTKAEALNLTAAAGVLTTGSIAVTISPAAASRFALSGSATLGASQCGTYTVTTQDTYQNTSAVTALTAVTLGGNGSGSFYSNGTCTTATNSVNVANAASTATVYFKDATGESLTLQATRSGWTMGTLSLTVLSPALLIISNGPSYDYGEKPSGGTTDFTFTVTNSGGQAVATTTAGTPALAAPFTFKGGTFPGTGGSCGGSIAATGGTCTMVVTFAPTGIAPDSTGVFYSNTVRVAYHDGVTNQIANREISGTGTPTSGNLDFSLNGSGKVVSALSPGGSVIYGLASDPAGNLVAIGAGDVGGDNNVAVARYLPTGDLDPSFGGGGTGFALTDVNGGSSNEAVAKAVAVAGDGSVFAAGHAYTGSKDEFLLLKYTTSGVLDTSFTGGTGYRTLDMGSTASRAQSMVLTTADGKPLLAGYGDDGSGKDLALARLDTSGTPDTGFGTGGALTLDISGADDEVRALVERASDGYLYAAGYTGTVPTGRDFVVVRFSDSGLLDNTFGTSGVKTVDFDSNDDEIFATALETGGSLVMAGYSETAGGLKQFTIARLLNNGNLDTTFNTTGYVRLTLGSGDSVARSVKVQADGKIVAGGYSIQSGNDHFTVVRLNANGSPDTSFGTNGVVTTTVSPSSYDRIYALLLQATGRIAVGGTAFVGSADSFALGRFWP